MFSFILPLDSNFASISHLRLTEFISGFWFAPVPPVNDDVSVVSQNRVLLLNTSAYGLHSCESKRQCVILYVARL